MLAVILYLLALILLVYGAFRGSLAMVLVAIVIGVLTFFLVH